jgi:glycosyltransferase involved in cell wall biosynthesis
MSRDVLNLLHFSNTTDRGGAEEHVLMLLRGINRRHFRLFWVCSPIVAAKVESDIRSDVELIPLWLNPRHLGGTIGLARILRDRKVDILHSHMFYSSVFASPVGWACRVPVIVETPHLREQWRHGWKASTVIDRTVGRFVDRYIAVSEANGRYLVNEKRLPARKVKVIQNGANLDRFHPSNPPPGLKESLGFALDDPVLLVAARLDAQKGHRVLLDAIPLIQAEFPRVRLVCVGQGSLQEELERHVAKLGISEAVRFAGYHSDILPWLALADICVLPSFYEGLPLVAIETLAAGKAMVATAVDGTPEVIVDGRTGLTVPPGDVKALAAAIIRLLRDPALRGRLASAGREWVLSRFTQERQIRETEEFYLASWDDYIQGRLR